MMRRVARPQFKSGVTILEQRRRWFFGGLVLVAFVIAARLAYWQIWKHQDLTESAEAQYQRQINFAGVRGSFFFEDGSPLVTNQQVYRVYATPHLLSEAEKALVVTSLSRVLVETEQDQAPGSGHIDSSHKLITASSSALQDDFLTKLNRPNARWVNLYQPITEATRQKIAELQLPQVGFDTYFIRYYPEASMAAHLTGFVGKTDQGSDQGYFGLEGAFDAELQPQFKTKVLLANALGFPLFAGDGESNSLDGRSLTTTLRRDVQYLLERQLEKGVVKYGAESGEIIVMQPQTGAILGLATWPHYDQTNFAQYPTKLYKNPALADTFEPGSTFKIITVATGIDTGAITPDTICPKCAAPRVFGQYTLKTWNEEYHPNISMRDAIAKSDNVAMIYVAETVGADKFHEYVTRFGIGDKVGVDLQDDTATPLPDSFRPVELATASFGQGISTTSLQLMKAVAVIANGGQSVTPSLTKSIHDPQTNLDMSLPNVESEPIVSLATAQQVTEMMVYAAQKGEAQWITSKTHLVAGKTGTAQVATKGGYDDSATIATYIGFAPPSDPQFLMFVKLTRPTTSPWAAETAAPLWYDTADDLYLLLNLPPDRILDQVVSD